jgi:hypothetical protein
MVMQAPYQLHQQASGRARLKCAVCERGSLWPADSSMAAGTNCKTDREI